MVTDASERIRTFAMGKPLASPPAGVASSVNASNTPEAPRRAVQTSASDTPQDIHETRASSSAVTAVAAKNATAPTTQEKRLSERTSGTATIPQPDIRKRVTQRPSATRLFLEQARKTETQPKQKGTGLFGSVEFKGSLSSLPQWQRVMRGMRPHADNFAATLPTTGTPNAREAWLAFRASVAHEPLMEKVRRVNAYFNRYPYRLDEEVWGVPDYWATPSEFASHSGDCEDYAISKYYALKDLGVDPKTMRIVALWDRIRGIGHAVLVVLANNTEWVLDNQTNLVLPDTRYGHYVPQYSVNEFTRWAHVPAK